MTVNPPRTSERRIAFPIQLLDQGQEVTDLQRALTFLALDLAEREVENGRFGRTTRTALMSFQEQQSLQPTGRVDEATAARLNTVLERAGFFPAKERPFRDRGFLRVKPRDGGRLDAEARSFVRQRLNDQLKETILRQFDKPGEALQTAVRELDLNYEDLVDAPLGAVVIDHVVPALLERPDLEEELEALTTRNFSPTPEPVAELLHLDEDLRRHPFFRVEARRARNGALGRIAGLDADQIEAVEDLDLEAAEADTWKRLVDEGVLTEQEGEELENTVEFAKLTGDQFEAIEALRGEGRRNPRALITLDKEDWQDFLRRHDLEPPEDEDVETYAGLLDLNVQRTFRTPYLMHRLVEREQEDVLQRTADLRPLLVRNEAIFVDGRINEALDWGDIDDDERARLEASLRELNRFANTYRHLGMAAILNDRRLTPQLKRRAMRRRKRDLETFHANNPDLDLEWVNFFPADSGVGRAFQPNWEGLSEEAQPRVDKTLKAFQRTEQLTECFDETEALLAAGLDSAMAVIGVPEKELAGHAELPEAVAHLIYQKAADKAVYTGHILSMVEEMTTHAGFSPAVVEGAIVPDLDIINVLDIDGYQELFGNQNYCHCKHCRSIFSPAAYFVDLMDFIHTNVSEPTFIEDGKSDHPLYLKNRRPDLWTLPLTCENTDTLIPYLEIVNRVLERYLETVFEEEDIYEALTGARLSFRQPFNLPFEALQLYLGHFRVALTDLYELFFEPALLSTHAAGMARARLGLAPQEFGTIIIPDTEEIELRYGNPADLLALDVQALIRHAGISRQELDRLLGLDFIAGKLEIQIEVKSLEDDLVGFEETMGFTVETPGGVSVLIHPHIRSFLDRLHRFIRLWRKLPWSPEQLHLVMTSLMDPLLLSDAGGTESLGQALDEEMVVNISHLRHIQDTFDLSVEELYALYHEIPTLSLQPEKPSLFTRLFGEQETLRIEHPALENTDPDSPAVSPDFGLLQGALRLSETQVLELIAQCLTPEIIQGAVLNHEHLSDLYRQALLARLLSLQPADLARVQAMLRLGIGPVKQTPAGRIQDLLMLLRFKQDLDETPFAAGDVWWLVTGETSGSAASVIGAAQIDELLGQVRGDPNLSFTPDSLAEIEGLTLSDAQALLNLMSDDDVSLNWVERPDEGQERYVLTPAFGSSPDFEAVIAFFTEAGDETEVAEQKAAAVQQQLLRHHPRTILITRLLGRFNITQAYFEALRPFLATDLSDEAFVTQLFAWLDPDNAADTQPLLDLLRSLERLLYVFTERLDLPITSLSFIAANPDLFALILPADLSWDSLRLLSLYARFLPDSVEEPPALHPVLSSWTGETFPEGTLPQLAPLLKTDVAQLQSLFGRINLPTSPLDALGTLARALKLAVKLGLDGAALKQMAAGSYADLNAAKDLVYGAIRAKYDERDWAEIIEPYQDKLNMIKRDALVDRVLSQEFQLKFEDTRELYQFFLLDVEMDGCARVSRVKEATLACQLYVHRCRMNLEQSESGDVRVLPEVIPADEWGWRKNYRVWEANRKVFLYPENWLEPDLRDDKTPIFEQVESELLQRAITPESAEAIYRNYLREFDELSKLINVSALYDHNEETYLFFARTPTSPYQYYWRKYIRNVQWTPWERIELEIAAPVVSAHLHRGRLYLFWTRVLTNKDKEGGELGPIPKIEENQPVHLEYSFRESTGRWQSPQRVFFHQIKTIEIGNSFGDDLNELPMVDPENVTDAFPSFSRKNLETTRHFDKVYLHTASQDTQIRVFHYYSPDKDVIPAYLNEYTNALDRKKNLFWSPNIPLFPFFVWANVLKIRPVSSDEAAIVVTPISEASLYGEVAYEDSLELLGTLGYIPLVLTDLFPISLEPELSIVHNQTGDFILSIDGQQFFIRHTGGEGYKRELSSLLEALIAYAKRKRDTIRLTTTLADDLGEVLFNQGLEAFLSLDTQHLTEAPVRFVQFEWIAELPPPTDTGTQGHLNFQGAHGPYFRELFFHIPFLIAHYLNANQKFAEADHWYHKIFDPTASESPAPLKPTDRNWRYIEFRKQTTPKLRQILTDATAIDQYKADPFNPFAIARLRISAFQKAVVMKYIDNLLDWGDHLFARDTFESINEATMLYVMAADILGDRPVEVGDCEIASEAQLTYQNILTHQRSGSEFLIELENLGITINAAIPKVVFELGLFGDQEETENGADPGAGFEVLRESKTQFTPYAQVKSAAKQQMFVPEQQFYPFSLPAKASAETAVQRTLAFCVPPNGNLLGYWGRVEDRLYKIRNCMNLQGVRRQLALFEPPIDPGLLVKAKAAGLSLEDVLSLLTADVPSYRFTYLIEQAKQLTNTVQSFGGALLSALEKKDTEELTLLRAVHEQELLKAVGKSKAESKTEAENNKLSLEQSKELATERKEYFIDLIENAKDPALGISQKEIDGDDKQDEAKTNEGKASKREQGASGINAAPLIGFDMQTPEIRVPFNFLAQVPFHLSASANISYSTANVASALAASANKFRRDASFRGIEASKALTRDGQDRRKKEWEHQKSLAESEETQIGTQILAAEARFQFVEKDLEAHDKQVEQAEELHDFYKDKFTNLGLYTYLSSSLSRLYREAYNMAHDMAVKAQSAYQFETDDSTFFIGNDNWPSDKAGLLAGERLLLQLQQMEGAYLEQNRRRYELTKHVSLALLGPRALLELRETGTCEFEIPEALFDLDHPGHYQRRIKSVSLTIPCVTGPYTTVSCTLTLMKHSVRKDNRLVGEENHYARNTEEGVPADDDRFVDTFGATQSIVTSSAQNDSGLFELNFRDERYLPFEGAGAIGRWRLELPDTFRQFDYDTITDAILHMNYTAIPGGDVFKQGAVDALENSLNTMISDGDMTGLMQSFSAKHDFPNQWHQFLHPVAAATRQTLRLDLTKERFPYMFKDHDLWIVSMELFLKLEDGVAYEDDDPLVFDLEREGGPTFGNNQWQAGDSPVDALPHATPFEEADHEPGPWVLSVDEEGLTENLSQEVEVDGDTRRRLAPEAFDDIVVICHYEVTDPA